MRRGNSIGLITSKRLTGRNKERKLITQGKIAGKRRSGKRDS